jgi:hypothetical protein
MNPTEPARETDRDLARVHAGHEAEQVIERLRRAAHRTVDTTAAGAALELAYRATRQHARSRPTSALVEQQQWFQRPADEGFAPNRPPGAGLPGPG